MEILTEPRRKFQTSAQAFNDRTIYAERLLLSAGFRNPDKLHDAAVDAGLNGTHFTSGNHSAIFTYVCLCAERGSFTSTSECMTVANQLPDVHLEREDFEWILWKTDDWRAEDLPMYAERVVINAHERQALHHHLTEIAKVLDIHQTECTSEARMQRNGKARSCHRQLRHRGTRNHRLAVAWPSGGGKSKPASR